MRRMHAGGTLGQSTKRLGTGDIIGYKTQYASMADCAQLANYQRNGCPEKMGTGLSSAAVPAGALASTQLTSGFSCWPVHFVVCSADSGVFTPVMNVHIVLAFIIVLS